MPVLQQRNPQGELCAAYLCSKGTAVRRLLGEDTGQHEMHVEPTTGLGVLPKETDSRWYDLLPAFPTVHDFETKDTMRESIITGVVAYHV